MAQPPRLAWLQDAGASARAELTRRYGAGVSDRATRGISQVSRLWRVEDGDRKAFEEFVVTNFAPDQPSLDILFGRCERLLEMLFGHMQEITREFRQQVDLDLGPIRPYDELFAGYDPAAHAIEDFFKNKIAFTALLNFPLTTLDQRLAEGASWTRRQWAETRLAQLFSKRIPADVNLAIAASSSEAERYISEYNIWMHHLVDDQGRRLFPPGMRLLSHWNLRDQIKADYADAQNGLARQRTIQKVMERIVSQTIPVAVIDNPNVDWNPFTNEVRPAAVKDGGSAPENAVAANPAPEGARRYEKLLGTFRAARKADPYSPNAPTLIARRFDENRELPEPRVKAMLESVLLSPDVSRTARLIESRLGRPLEPFDIWYNGFRAPMKYSEAELDSIVARRYPNAEAYRADIPRMLESLGFAPEHARSIAANIVVDPARGSGHAMGAAMRDARAHLRTRIEKGGMNYKGFNIAVHEMGHNVEQTLSLNGIDHYLLNGVPNTAFTEALAFVFQARDLQLLGLPAEDPNAEALKTLNDFWGTYEISAVALVDMAVWHWMYEHSDATAAQLREAVIGISKDTWNRYCFPVFHTRDVVLLGIYSHMIDASLYLPDYPIGHLIAHQIEEQIRKKGAVGPEFERMVRSGSIAPDLWMRNATGSPVGAEALLDAVGRALAQVEASRR